MIYSLYELNETINNVVNRIVEYGTQNTLSGQRYIGYDVVSDLISEKDYLQYIDFIESELSGRQEILDLDVLDGEFDCNFALNYCPSYHWTDGDEEVFDCSFEEWEQMPTKPISQPLSISRLAAIGEAAIAHVMETSDIAIEDLTENLGMSMEEIKQLGVHDYGYENFEQKVDVSKDLLVGKWRVHIVPPGNHYGQLNQLINEEKDAIVEFHDMGQDKEKFPNGQFTGASYYARTLLGTDGWGTGKYPNGLSLWADIPAWTVSSAEMEQVISYIREWVDSHDKRPTLSETISSIESRIMDNKKTTTSDKLTGYKISEKLDER